MAIEVTEAFVERFEERRMRLELSRWSGLHWKSVHIRDYEEEERNVRIELTGEYRNNTLELILEVDENNEYYHQFRLNGKRKWYPNMTKEDRKLISMVAKDLRKVWHLI